MRYELFARKLAECYVERGLPSVDDFPEIGLYMDQMVAVLNKNLALYAEEPNGPINKAMVSNYTKHGMIPGADGKKYSKEHMIFMTMAFLMKDCFSMEQIERLFKPTIANFKSEWDDKVDIAGGYEKLVSFLEDFDKDLPSDVEKYVATIKKTTESEGEGDDIMELELLIIMLVMKSNAERFMAKKLLEEYFPAKK